MMEHSFEFCGIDFRQKWGLIVESITDYLQPKLRENKQAIPHRSGAADFGARYRDERVVQISCGAVNLSRAQIRELAFDVARKGNLYLWTEPDKYYVGQIYDPGEIERIVQGKKFVLSFVCDPFAYGEQITEDFTNSAELAYAGTAETPTVITITNNNNYDMTGITITMREVANQ